MADYAAVNGGDLAEYLTYTASGAITAGQVLVFSAADTVSPSAAASQAIAGVAAHDAASGALVTVITGGGIIHETVTTATTVAVGNLMASAAAGAIAPGATAGQEVGTAVRAITSTSGGTLRWKSAR